MIEIGKYLYCIIGCREERTFDRVGIGCEDGIVHTVCYKGLAAVISDSPVKRYESTRDNMMAHERVLETVMKEFTLLPVRFGTVTDSASPAQAIYRLLSGRYKEFYSLLRDMEGKVELGLKAFWRDERAAFGEIVTENANIRRLRDSLTPKSPKASHFDRIRLGEMVKEALNRKRVKESNKILLPLRQIAYSVRENETLADRMVVNAAFLVDTSKEPAFDQAVSKLNEQFGERVAFKYVGPVPPYNFVNIVVNWEELT